MLNRVQMKKSQGKENNLLKIDDAESLMKFLQEPTLKIAEAVTGILASDVKDWKLSAGKLVQATIKGKLFTQIGKEIEKYREEGKIKEDYFETDMNRASFKELLKFIDEETPDEIRFKAMKSIFLSSVSKDINEGDEELAYELMQICGKLSSGEILVLKASWDIVNNRISPNISSGVSHGLGDTRMWLSFIAQQIGHGIPSLVEVYEDTLIELKLITSRKSDGSIFGPTQYFRLTPLGYKLCEFITKYE